MALVTLLKTGNARLEQTRSPENPFSRVPLAPPKRQPTSSGKPFARSPEDYPGHENASIANISHDSDSERLAKVAPGSTVFVLTSQKTEIAKYACEPKLQGFPAEDALAKQYLEQKSLVT